MLLGFFNYLVFDCGMSVVLIKNDDDDDDECCNQLDHSMGFKKKQ